MFLGGGGSLLRYGIRTALKARRGINITRSIGAAPRGFSTFTNLRSTALNSANVAYKGSTKLGHSLSKHSGRHPQTWGRLTGNPSTWHDQALKHFDDIMDAPGSFTTVKNKHGIDFLEKRLPDGRGMRLNMDQTFKGFID